MAQNDDPAVQAATWKRKYYDALGEHESKERQWKQADELLRKTVSRLTLAADGLDNTLDGHLRDLRDAIRDRADARVLRQRIEAMSESLVRLDAKRAKKTAAPPPAASLQRLLEKLDLPRGYVRRVKALTRQLEGAGDEQIAPAVAEFAKLLQDILNEAAATTGDEPGKSGGLLSRLFGSKPDTADAVAATDEAPASVADAGTAVKTDTSAISLAGARDMLLHVLDQFQALVPRQSPNQTAELRNLALRATGEVELKRLADALAKGFNIPVDSPVEATSTATTALAETISTSLLDDPACGSQLLLQLLQRLDLPAELEPQVEALKDQLGDTANFDAQRVLSDMATLIADMRTRLQNEKNDIEDFLKQLTGQLQDIDSLVRGADSARGEAYQSGVDLGNAVQAQVRGIEDSVASAPDLDVLKRAVQMRLEAIMDHVEQHRVKEELRNAQVEAQMRDLGERINDMEGESVKLRERLHEERNQALTDVLTGIPNRLAYQERVAQEYARWKRFNTPLALLVWDVDHFKAVNDEYGHRAGDKVLKVIAETLYTKIRETDFLARYGGEEFVLVMTGTQQPAILEVADKLRQAVETCGFHFRGESVSITISCGIAEFREGDVIEAVFERADAALYKAKANGRNQCVVDGAA